MRRIILLRGLLSIEEWIHGGADDPKNCGGEKEKREAESCGRKSTDHQTRNLGGWIHRLRRINQQLLLVLTVRYLTLCIDALCNSISGVRYK